MQVHLEYELSKLNPKDANGDHQISLTGGSLVDAPAAAPIPVGTKSVRLAGLVAASTNVSDIVLDTKSFTIRAVIRLPAALAAPETIVDSDRFPFGLRVEPGIAAGAATLVTAFNSKKFGWRAADTRYVSPPIGVGIWYTLDLAYDGDTLALFVDEQLVSLQAFPQGAPANMAGKMLYVGSRADGQQKYSGDIAALQLMSGIPDAHKAKIDEARTTAGWYISYKALDVEATVSLGAATSAVRFDTSTGGHVQDFQYGMLMYHDSIGRAHEMHGAIWQAYRSLRRRAFLGYLVSDELAAREAGARKSLFSKGGYYFTPSTGAVYVIGKFYLNYENLGETGYLGAPVSTEKTIAGGKEQVFGRGRMYHRTNAPRAYEVHGAILDHFLATGGTIVWGFPITDEADVIKRGPTGRARVIGRSSEFEGATFFWSGQTGAFEVHGDIKEAYLDTGGPAGELGFPTSDERDIPDAAGAARMNTFQKGSILWFGSANSIRIAWPFKIKISRVATKESEGAFMGQNDLYTFIRASDGSQTYDKRHPSSGDWGGHNSRDINFTIPLTFVPNRPDLRVDFRFVCWDSDPFDDDHLGTLNRQLNAANAWGLTDNQGAFNDQFAKVNSLTWSVVPQINVAALSETQKWWGAANKGTPTITYDRYAQAFRDVDSDTEFWDPGDWLEKAFYELVVDTLAESGNCFGMALEGIYARKDRSNFALPLDKFKNAEWGRLEPDFNIRHCYQVGAEAIWWFVAQFLSGQTHDPKGVFERSNSHFSIGDHPVVCIAQNYDFSGAPHCILPVAWRKSGTQWLIDILDPNSPGQIKTLEVDAAQNTFRYDRGGGTIYSGGEWTGGRFHFMPYCLLSSRPRTPIWDLIMLILSGTAIIFAGAAESESITDSNGKDLDAFGQQARTRLKRRQPIDDCFFRFRGFAGEALRSGFLLRQSPSRAKGDPGSSGHGRLEQLGSISQLREKTAAHLVRELLSLPPQLRQAIESRPAHRIVADQEIRRQLSPAILDALKDLALPLREGSFDHRLRGTKRGKFDYLVRSAGSLMRVGGAIAAREAVQIGVRDIATSRQSLKVSTASKKLLDVSFETLIGSGRDRMRVDIEGLPAEAQQGIELNLRPGLGGIDAMLANDPVDARIKITANIGRRTVRRTYTAPLEGGLRFSVAEALDTGALNVGRIDQLFGPTKSSSRIAPQ